MIHDGESLIIMVNILYIYIYIYTHRYLSGWWLSHLSENISPSVGMMRSNVSNHQAAMYTSKSWQCHKDNMG